MLIVAVVSLLLRTVAGAATPQPRHAVIERIAGPDGGYDYLSIDSARQRLFVGREFGVMAVDLATKKVTEKLLAADDVAAVLIIPGTDLMLATAYDANTAILFNRTTGAVQARIATGKSPDAAFHEPSSGLVFVMNADSNDTTVIDLKAAKAVATIPMGGKPEAATADGRGFVFINIEDTAEVAVVDVASRKVIRRLKLAGCVEPTGIAYDAATGTLISACHNNVVKLTDARTGADRGSVKVGKDADGAIFDAKSRLAYIPCDDGTLTIFQLDAQAMVRVVEVVTTQPGARTAAFDPQTGRIYLAANKSTADDKEVPGTFNILVVAPAP
jgi:YVTN family beta-propeller protein